MRIRLGCDGVNLGLGYMKVMVVVKVNVGEGVKWRKMITHVELVTPHEIEYGWDCQLEVSVEDDLSSLKLVSIL